MQTIASYRHYSIYRLVLAVSALLVLGAATAIAQSPRLYVSTRQAQTLLNRIENRTDTYKSTMQRTFNNNDRRSENREDRIMDLISDFENATDTLRVRVGSRTVITGEVNDVFEKARLINSFMLRNRLNNQAESQWTLIRNDLNTLAGYYRMTWSWDSPIPAPIGGNPTYPTINDAQFRALVDRIERNTNTFRSRMTTALFRQDRDRREEINGYIAEFERATDELASRYNSRRATETDAREVLSRGAYIDRYMTSNAFARPAENQWRLVRNDLDRLASYYRVSWSWDNPDLGPIAGNPTYPTINDSEFRKLVDRIERNTNTFRARMTTALYRQDREKRNEITGYIAEFERATDELSNRFNTRRATEQDAREVLSRGAYIDRFMTANTFTRPAETQWGSIRSDLDRLAGYYRVAWNWNDPMPGTGGWTDYATIEGTYRLNRSRSDNVSTVIDRSIGDYSSAQRENIRRNLERRLASPEMIAFDTSGTSVTMATSNSQRASFQANGVGSTETNNRGRSVTTTATLDRYGLRIDHTGDRVNDYYLTFTPSGTNQMTVTRRLFLEGRNDTITTTSVYDKISAQADWSAVNAGPTWENNTGSLGDFYVPNGTRMTAQLNTAVSTKASQIGDRVLLTVTSPNQYRNAVIEGRIVEAERSGRFTGRANMSITFDSIRVDGRSYRFGGIIDAVRAENGDSISVNNEGAIRDDSQTTKTVTRAGIGAVLGAIIGAIAGGGDGAAIGAGVGAGAGAGSVLITGKDSLELGIGSTFDLTATAPSDRRVGRN